MGNVYRIPARLDILKKIWSPDSIVPEQWLKMSLIDSRLVMLQELMSTSSACNSKGPSTILSTDNAAIAPKTCIRATPDNSEKDCHVVTTTDPAWKTCSNG